MKHTKKSNKVYIYNPVQSSYFLEEGCKLLTINRHFSSGKLFWVFKYNKKYIEAMKKWCDQNKK